ncbi:KTSC domain-containing protein [Mesorhizobium sp. KR1-2]|uniref:KTSC domain-containing protein n=1 Tax=Mesorhizobium sp. KR1-2 TaxID=3156609 RepID=UPI0032B3E4C1
MPVFNSTAIRRAEYDSSTGVLQLWFTESGGPYNYYGVPPQVFDGLCRASSKGGYFNSHIRDRYSVAR